jgi:hypothetical protein
MIELFGHEVILRVRELFAAALWPSPVGHRGAATAA